MEEPVSLPGSGIVATVTFEKTERILQVGQVVRFRWMTGSTTGGVALRVIGCGEVDGDYVLQVEPHIDREGEV